MKAITPAGAMPANVSDSERAMVTAGLANVFRSSEPMISSQHRARDDTAERADLATATMVMPMRALLRSAMYLATASIIAGSATNAAALPLTPFRYEAQAQRHCPEDTVVWLDFRKRIYYLKRQNRYAHGSTGSFVCLDEARSSGYRRSLLGLR